MRQKIKNKKQTLVIKGFVPVGVVREVDFYYARTKEKFLANIGDLTIGDLYDHRENIHLESSDFPMLDMYKGIAKIKIEIEL